MTGRIPTMLKGAADTEQRTDGILMQRFFLKFVSLIGYLVFFNFHSDKVQNSPYNRRQDSQSTYVRRGDILDSKNNVLATTQVDANGKEIRVYPYSNMFSHSVGYSTNGKSGVESIMNYDLLTSHDNFLDRIVNEFKGVKNTGDTVVTTLDANLQQAAYNALGEYQGAVIVLDPHLGSVLAMVSKPDFALSAGIHLQDRHGSFLSAAVRHDGRLYL